MKKIDQYAKIFNLPIFSRQKSDLLNYLEAHLASSRELVTVMTPNPEQVVLSQQRPSFKEALLSADVLLPDGAGLVLASRLLNPPDQRISERIPGNQVVAELLELASSRGWPVLVIGG